MKNFECTFCNISWEVEDNIGIDNLAVKMNCSHCGSSVNVYNRNEEDKELYEYVYGSPIENSEEWRDYESLRLRKWQNVGVQYPSVKCRMCNKALWTPPFFFENKPFCCEKCAEIWLDIVTSET